MISIGATLSPQNRGEIAKLSLDFIEVKNIEPEFLESCSDVLSRFVTRTMHVQYLPSFDQKPTTLNLASSKTIQIIDDDKSTLFEAYRLLEPRLISFHLGFSSEEVGTEGIDNHNYARGRVLSKDETFEKISMALLTISDQFRKIGYKGEILIENLDYHPTGAYEHICEAEFISDIIKYTGCFALFDVAHAMISSYHLGIDVIDYVSKIDIDSIYEVHVNSPFYKDGEWYDINRPFHQLAEAEEITHIILNEKRKRGQELLLNIESDEEIGKQLSYLRRSIYVSQKEGTK